MQTAGPLRLRCPRCDPVQAVTRSDEGATITTAQAPSRSGSAFTPYCRRCKTRLVAAAPGQDAPSSWRTAIRYGGVAFGAREGEGEGERNVDRP